MSDSHPTRSVRTACLRRSWKDGSNSTSGRPRPRTYPARCTMCRRLTFTNGSLQWARLGERDSQPQCELTCFPDGLRLAAVGPDIKRGRLRALVDQHQGKCRLGFHHSRRRASHGVVEHPDRADLVKATVNRRRTMARETSFIVEAPAGEVHLQQFGTEPDEEHRDA